MKNSFNKVLSILLKKTVILCCCTCVANANYEDGNIPGSIRLNLPNVIYAVAGIETNIYFDNVILSINRSNYVFDVTCEKGIQQKERWTYKPADDEVGIYPILFEVKDQINSVVARAKSKISVAPAESGNAMDTTMLCIGDSLTYASEYTGHLLQLAKKSNGARITLVGSHVPDSDTCKNRHEGYGGWTAKFFATHYTGVARTSNYSNWGSPFIYKDNNGKSKLNFAEYCKEFNDGKPPDIVTIFLGANDIFYADDDTIENTIDEMFVHYDMLVKMIQEFNSETIIGVILPVPPAASQDAFGANYKCGQTYWQYKRNQHRLVERILKHYGNRQSENIYIVPANINLDCVYNYPISETVSIERTSDRITRHSNALHPTKKGYEQIGDTIYFWLKYLLDKTEN